MANEAQTGGRLSRQSMDLPAAYKAPEGALERKVALAFAEVFGLDQVGADDDFYDLGGDSLLGETLSMELLTATGQKFQMSWFFEFGTPAKIAAKISNSRPETFADRPPIFTVHGRGGFTVPKPSFHAGLAAGQKLVMFELPGIRGLGPSYSRVEDIASAYVEELQTAYPEGPILLAAFCTGGLIAVEMAAQLARSGRPVHHMVLLDPGLPATLHRRQHADMRRLGLKMYSPSYKPTWTGQLRYRCMLASMRLGTLLVLGRPSDGSSERDFADERLHWWAERYFLATFAAQRVYARLLGRVKHPGMGLRVTPKAKMRAAFARYWPPTYDGTVDIISSEFRRHTFEDPNHVWARVFPKLKVHVTVAEHSDILAAEATVTAAEMQAMFDASLSRLDDAKPVQAPATSSAPILAVEPAE